MIPDQLFQRTRHAFCLPGGGAKGAVQTGAINRCLELGVEADMVFATSAGSLNGIMVAMRKYELLNELWEQTGNTAGRFIFESYLAELHDGTVRANVSEIRNILSAGLNFGDKIGLITKKGQKKFLQKIVDNAKGIDHLLDNSPLRETLLKHVRMEDVKVPFSCTLVSLYDGALYTVPHTRFKDSTNLALGVLASTSIPGICAPVQEIHLADGTVIFDAVDGGLRSSSPLPQCMSAIPAEDDWVVWGFNCNSITQQLNKTRKNLLTQAGASVDIMLNDGFARDVKMSTKINEWAMKYPEFREGEGIKVARIFNIEAPLDEEGNPLLGSTMDFRQEWIKKRMAIGYESVNMYFEQLSV